MRSRTLVASLVLMMIPLTATAQERPTPSAGSQFSGFSGRWVGQGQTVRAQVAYNARARTLSITEWRDFSSTTSSSRTSTLMAHAGSPRLHTLFHQTYYVGARPVEKNDHGIYVFRNRDGKLTNSSRRPEGTMYHRIHVPASIQITSNNLRHIAEQALGVTPGRYNSVIVTK